MNIGQAAQASGVPAKMIRYYESIGLIPSLARSAGGYREFGDAELQRLSFIQRGRKLGFSLDHIRSLLELQGKPNRNNSEVKLLALTQIQDIENRIQELRIMSENLRELIGLCNDQIYCPIIRSLEDHQDSAPDCPASAC